MSVFSVGTVLSRTFSTFFKHPFVFIGLSLLSQVAGFIINLVLGFAGETIAAIAILAAAFLILITQGAVAYGVYETLRGNAAQFSKSLSRGLARIIPLTLGVLLFYIALALVFALGAIGVAVAGLAFGFLAAVVIIALPLALLAAILFFKWIVFVPACVVEGLGPVKSLSRSSELTDGCRLKIVALYLMGFTVLSIVFFVTALSTHIHPVFTIVELIVDAIPIAFLNVMTAVIYYELRSVKEGVSIESLTSVFD